MWGICQREKSYTFATSFGANVVDFLSNLPHMWEIAIYNICHMFLPFARYYFPRIRKFRVAEFATYNIPGDQLACSYEPKNIVFFILKSPSTIKGKQLFCITVVQYLANMLCWETMFLQGFWSILNNRKISLTASWRSVERTTPQHGNRCFPIGFSGVSLWSPVARQGSTELSTCHVYSRLLTNLHFTTVLKGLE